MVHAQGVNMITSEKEYKRRGAAAAKASHFGDGSGMRWEADTLNRLLRAEKEEDRAQARAWYDAAYKEQAAGYSAFCSGMWR